MTCRLCRDLKVMLAVHKCDAGLRVLTGLVGLGSLSFLNELCKLARAGTHSIIPRHCQLLSFRRGIQQEVGIKLFLRDCYFEMKQVIVDHFGLDPETYYGGRDP